MGRVSGKIVEAEFTIATFGGMDWIARLSPNESGCILALADWDNSDPSLPSLTHWCHGSCCKGRSREAKEAFALLQVCKHFVLLFALGFPVPLSYRWVHAERANQYIKETRFYLSSFFDFYVMSYDLL